MSEEDFVLKDSPRSSASREAVESMEKSLEPMRKQLQEYLPIWNEKYEKERNKTAKLAYGLLIDTANSDLAHYTMELNLFRILHFECQMTDFMYQMIENILSSIPDKDKSAKLEAFMKQYEEVGKPFLDAISEEVKQAEQQKKWYLENFKGNESIYE
ncbi:MAG: hypothetical protein ACREBS_10760 [Nitrososphaerales archaeon]